MKYQYKASIIIPTRNRSALFESRLQILFDNTPELRNGEAELIVSLDKDDNDTRLMLYKYPTVQIFENPPLEIPCIKWNNAAYCALGEWLVTVSDDCVPENYWLSNALSMLSYGFLGLPDGVTGSRNQFFTPLYMAKREWLRKYNGGVLVIPKYKSWYADIETAMRAHRSHTYVVAGRSVLTQLHSIFQTAPDDEIYRIGRERQAEDKKTYNQREIDGFPDDFEAIL